MNTNVVPTRKAFWIGLALFFAGLLAACQVEEKPTPPPPVESQEFQETPPLGQPTAVQPQPTAESTSTPSIIQPTVTSPVPTPTPPLIPTSTPLPPPEPTYYPIQPGDTLFSISENFNVFPENLALANGFASIEEAFLIAGTDIQIPLCQAHEIVLGNTLAAISQMCGLTLDDLVTANITSLAPLGSFDAVPPGFILIIPQESQTPEGLDCTILPAREQVIEYLPKTGEGLYCLSQKFNISTTAIIQANIRRLTGDNVYGQVPLLIPPTEGAVYTISEFDVAAAVTLTELAEWYVVTPEAITDLNGNPVIDPLQEGQQLLITGANLIAGPFRSQSADNEGAGVENNE